MNKLLIILGLIISLESCKTAGVSEVSALVNYVCNCRCTAKVLIDINLETPVEADLCAVDLTLNKKRYNCADFLFQLPTDKNTKCKAEIEGKTCRGSYAQQIVLRKNNLYDPMYPSRYAPRKSDGKLGKCEETPVVM